VRPNRARRKARDQLDSLKRRPTRPFWITELVTQSTGPAASIEDNAGQRKHSLKSADKKAQKASPAKGDQLAVRPTLYSRIYPTIREPSADRNPGR
jgi:hypothetical protein